MTLRPAPALLVAVLLAAAACDGAAAGGDAMAGPPDGHPPIDAAPDRAPSPDAPPADAFIQEDAGPGSAFNPLYRDLLAAGGCAGRQCHGLDPGRGGLSLGTAGLAYRMLVGEAARNCRGWTRVVPGKPDASFFYRKLAGTHPRGCGLRMPTGALPLSGALIARVRAWIAGGARR